MVESKIFTVGPRIKFECSSRAGTLTAKTVMPNAETTPAHNLPPQITSFIGRVQEIAEVRRELARSRLVTLTGPGGIGKTRLALCAAEEEFGAFRDGIWFVDLAAVQDEALVQTR